MKSFLAQRLSYQLKYLCLKLLSQDIETIRGSWLCYNVWDATTVPVIESPMKYYLWTMNSISCISFSITRVCLITKKAKQFGWSPTICQFTECAASSVGIKTEVAALKAFSPETIIEVGKKVGYLLYLEDSEPQRNGFRF